MLYLFVIAVILAVMNVLQLYYHYKEKKEIFDRYMAKNLQEYKYYEEDYPSEIKRKENMFKDGEKNRKKSEKVFAKMSDAEREKIAKAKDF